MATTDRFKALSNIEHGEQLEDGRVKIHDFPYGSIVEGLPDDVMKNLWDAGVLERVKTEETPEATVTIKEKESEAPQTPAAPDSGKPSTGSVGTEKVKESE
jgi:hypothetical protein